MVVNALHGYDKFYFLGGSATWGNIRGLIAHNLDNLEIYEEGSYDQSRDDVWGISDLHLFEAANDVLRQRQRPFFAFIQTAGNHRPYTIPDDRRDFELADVDVETLRSNGFENLEAFNGLRFLDFALGRFLELARQEPYFSNTVFAFYGDHGGPTPLPTPWNTIGLTTNHVPGVIYAPGFLPEGREIDTVGSLVDLLPTSLSLIGVPYVNTTLGRDLLTERPPEQHVAMIWDGVINERFLLKVDPQGVARLYEYQSDQPSLDVGDRLPEPRDQLRRLYEDLDAVARYLLYNNPPVADEHRTSARDR
jgi:phosphoglycerol transferase MdoB-like AlkP superfamily enzyme